MIRGQLDSPRIMRVVFDRAPGNTVFDCAVGFLGPGVGTPGSSIAGDYADL